MWYYVNIQHVELSLFGWWAFFPLWMDFFVVGMYLSIGNRDYKIWPFVLAFIVAYIFSFAEERYWIGQGIRCSCTLTSHIYCLMAVYIFLSKRLQMRIRENNVIFRCCAYIGRCSFGIYLTHMYLITILIDNDRVIPIQLPWIIKIAVVLIINISFIWLVKRVIPSRFLTYVGF